MAQATSYKVSDSLYLVLQERDVKAPAKPIDVQTNHILVIDCSGSMSGDLPQIREQLKRKLPKLLKDGDTVSIIWFSGRSEFGVLLEAEPVATLTDLNDVNAAIDRWLRPVGLTGFKEPLEEVPNLIGRIAKKNKGVFSLFFMSDGCDNQWDRPSIIKAVEKAAGSLAAATFVEYGYYADRPLLSSMAEKAGGILIFSEGFDKYSPIFEAAIQRKLTGAPRVEQFVSGDPVCNFAFALIDGDLTTFSIESGKVQIPESLKEFYYLSPSLVGNRGGNIQQISEKASGGSGGHDVLNAVYAASSLFSVRMKPDILWPLLKALGDVRFIESFGGCFGKQKYSDFMDSTRLAAFDPKLRYLSGWDPNKVPQDDAFTVLDLLKILAEDDGNRLLLDSPDFKYSRIGRGRVDATSVLTTEELTEVQELAMKMASEKDPKKLTEISDQIKAISASKGPGLKFIPDPTPDGYPISNLTFNEDRPNVSVLVRKSGKVDVTPRLPDSLKGKVTEVATFVYRNYAIIKDGLVNVDKLPVKVTDGTWKKLCPLLPQNALESAAGLSGGNIPDALLLNLKALPVINRKMVNSISAKSFFEIQYELLVTQAKQKVYKSYADELLPKRKVEGLAETYGPEVAAWLVEQGFTDYSGFSPKTVQAEAKDYYIGKELKVSLKGFSKLPSMKELRDAIAKGKLNGPAQLMKPVFDDVENFLASDIYKKAARKEAVLEVWLDGQKNAAIADTRRLIYEIAQTTFCLVVGQIWFKEFNSLDENSMTIDAGAFKIECKAEMRDIQIKI
ncbi:MAG TPA: vWA domain-containing protein [Methylobacter sp.]|jgi:hypothetical protein